MGDFLGVGDEARSENHPGCPHPQGQCTIPKFSVLFFPELLLVLWTPGAGALDNRHCLFQLRQVPAEPPPVASLASRWSPPGHGAQAGGAAAQPLP